MAKKDTGEPGDISKLMLTYRARIPFSKDFEEDVKSFHYAENSGASLFSVDIGVANFACTAKFDRFSNVAARYLSRGGRVDTEKLLSFVTAHQLEEKDLLDASIGSERSFLFNKPGNRNFNDGIVVTAEIPLSEDTQDLYEDCFLYPTAEEKHIRVGGCGLEAITAKRRRNGSWEARSDAMNTRIQYFHKTFPPGTSKNEIIHALALGVALRELGEARILPHIKDHGLSAENIKMIETASGVVYKKPEGDVPVADPGADADRDFPVPS